MVQITIINKGNEMKFIKKQINNTVNKIELLNTLEKLLSDLEKMGPVPNNIAVYDYAVRFFNIISTFQDTHSINPKLINDTQVDAQRIMKYINAAGRYSQNSVCTRTKAGDIITPNNLYIRVKENAIAYKSVAFIKDHADSRTKSNASKTLFTFVNTYHKSMIESLRRIVRFNKKPDNFIIRRAYEKRRQFEM